MSSAAYPMVVVGIDDGDPKAYLAALQLADREAAIQGAAIKLVHGCAPQHQIGFLNRALVEERTRRGRRLVNSAARRLARMTSLSRRIYVTNSPLSGLDALLAESASPTTTMVVVQRRQPTMVKRLAGGSTSAALAARAGCPVAVVRPDHAHHSGTERRNVVVDVDDCDRSAAAVALAFEEASRRRADVTVVHAFELATDPAPYSGCVPPDDSAVDAARQQGLRLLSNAVGPVEVRYPGVRVHRVAAWGLAAQVLMEAAATADLLVVSRFDRAAFGPVSVGPKTKFLIGHAPCPVLVAPARTPTRRSPKGAIVPGRR